MDRSQWGHTARHHSAFDHLVIIVAIAALSAGVLAGCGEDNGGGTNPIVATRLGFVVQPSPVATGAVIVPAVQVAIQDAGGATVTSSTAPVTLSIGANPGGAALGGTLTVTAVNGIATFTDLTLSQPGAGYTLTATSPGLSAATSTGFSVETPSAPAKLGFVVQPSTVVNGVAIAPALEVAVQDTAGLTVTSSTAPVTIAIGANPGGATLGGTLTKAAVNGIATFSDLTLDQMGTGYTLTATSPGLIAATSSSFDVIATPSVPTAITVTTSGNAFVSVRNGTQNPAVDTLRVGGTVEWTNLGNGLHLVVSDGPVFFTSQSVAALSYGPLTLSSVGTYDYHCSVHGLSMNGRIEVVP